MPVLGMEIDNATLSVTGLAAIECTLLSEPLMHGLQLYRSNDPQHMLALATAMAAIRLTLDSLAAEQKRAGSCLNRPQQWPGRPWPLSQGKYESWRIQKLYGNTTYLLQPPEEATGSQSARLPTASPQPVPLVAKFWQPQGGHAVADLVQAAWHKQGVAPEVVSDPWRHVQTLNLLQCIFCLPGLGTGDKMLEQVAATFDMHEDPF